MTTQKFKKLLKQIYKGDTNALSCIYNEYYKKMVVSATYILKNKQDAEDAASNVILKILNMALQNEDIHIKNVGAYMNVSIKNEAINIYNKRKNFVSENAIVELGSNDPRLNRVLEWDSINASLESLSDSEKEIAILFYFYDYKIKEIASALNIPEGTIKWKLNIIRKKVKEIL